MSIRCLYWKDRSYQVQPVHQSYNDESPRFPVWTNRYRHPKEGFLPLPVQRWNRWWKGCAELVHSKRHRSTRLIIDVFSLYIQKKEMSFRWPKGGRISITQSECNRDSSLRSEWHEGIYIITYSNYLACSNCKVLVGSSHTSVGPKYWIGPGYT